MNAPRLNLVVVRVPDIDVAHAFYASLGLRFEKHAHGNGPVHYACEQNGIVFEIYPAASVDAKTCGTRIGFEVDDIHAATGAAKAHGALKISSIKETPWGMTAILEDPFGIPVHLVQAVK